QVRVLRFTGNIIEVPCSLFALARAVAAKLLVGILDLLAILVRDPAFGRSAGAIGASATLTIPFRFRWRPAAGAFSTRGLLIAGAGALRGAPLAVGRMVFALGLAFIVAAALAA